MSKPTLMFLLSELVRKYDGQLRASAAIGASPTWVGNQLRGRKTQVFSKLYLQKIAEELNLQWHEVAHLLAIRDVKSGATAGRAERESRPEGTTHILRGEPVRIVRLAGKKRYFRWVSGQWVQSTWVEDNKMQVRRFLR